MWSEPLGSTRSFVANLHGAVAKDRPSEAELGRERDVPQADGPKMHAPPAEFLELVVVRMPWGARGFAPWRLVSRVTYSLVG
jgi:hypothetical protein